MITHELIQKVKTVQHTLRKYIQLYILFISCMWSRFYIPFKNPHSMSPRWWHVDKWHWWQSSPPGLLLLMCHATRLSDYSRSIHEAFLGFGASTEFYCYLPVELRRKLHRMPSQYYLNMIGITSGRNKKQFTSWISEKW